MLCLTGGCQDLTLWYGGTGTLATWSFGTTDAPCIVPQAGESWRVEHGFVEIG